MVSLSARQIALVREKVHITGDGNVVGDDNVVITQRAGDYGIQIGQVVNVTLSFDALRRLLNPYTPPPPPDPDTSTLPDYGPLPPGSRMYLSRNALFTGRQKALRTLARTFLHAASGGLAACVVHGMAGVGKTQLAVEFVHRWGRYFHGVQWIDAARPAVIESKVAACGAAMGLPRWPDQLPDQVARTLAAWKEGGSA